MKLQPLLMLFLAGATLAGEAETKFVGVEKYADGVLEGRPQEDAPKALEAHFKKLAEKYLPANEKLLIEVTDVDLAGAEEWHPPATRMIRFMREVTPPAISLRYRLLRGEEELAKADTRIVDLNYLHHINPYSEGTAYRYEKLMLDEWFRRTFTTPAGR